MSSVSGDTSISCGEDSNSVLKKSDSMLHLAHIDGKNLHQMSPCIRDQKEILSVGQEPTGDGVKFFSNEGQADHNVANYHEAADNEEATANEDRPCHFDHWSTEGLDEFDASQIRHANAFYTLVKKWYVEKVYTSILFTKVNYDKRVKFLCHLKAEGACRTF